MPQYKSIAWQNNSGLCYKYHDPRFVLLLSSGLMMALNQTEILSLTRNLYLPFVFFFSKWHKNKTCKAFLSLFWGNQPVYVNPQQHNFYNQLGNGSMCCWIKYHLINKPEAGYALILPPSLC